jgi:hypothetical protein
VAVYTETINMDGNLGTEAKRAADQVGVLEKGLKSAEDALVRAAALGDQKGFAKATASVASYKAAIDAVPPALLAVASANERNEFLAKKAATAAKVAADAQVQAAVDSSKAMDKAIESAAGWAAAIGKAALAAAAALGALVVAGIGFAISANEGQRAADGLFDALGQGAITGAEVGDIIDGLRAKTGIAADTLEQYAKAYVTMGITGKAALEGLTLAAASAEALAKGGGKAFTDLFQKVQLAADAGGKLKLPFKALGSTLAAVGLNVGDLAKEMQLTTAQLSDGLAAGTIDAKKFGDAMQLAVTKKGAGPLKNLANTAANLGATLKEYLGELFEDLGDSIGPFMDEVKSLFQIFDSKTNPSGEALKAGIGGFFKEVFAVLTKVVPMVKHFFLDLIIYGLQAYIALKPIAAAIQAFAESEEGIAAIEMLKTMLMGAAIAAGVVVAAIAAVGVTIAATVAIVVGTLAALGMALTLAWQQLTSWAIQAGVAANNFVAGLVGGITAGAAQVVGAVKGLASQATAAFKGALGIASPSKVMMEMGGHMGTGVALGLDGTTGDVAASSTGVAVSAVDAASTVPMGGAAGGGGGGGVNVTIEAGAIVIQGGASASVVELTEQAVAIIFERIASQQGLMA